ncbi:hypothetical protein CEUSTIGMA_g2760.t1 [Chlamydomonas eustigma]|uniref:Ubiquitin-like protease family profile domain-containing protein n=1 Tax=Chlamydomonas eustigma TaxID=1157962 RepID=A0A250WX01_9CHLO|nr:hypothetical protein CEUSTIGMA_g2760.t1 [Chlamydomonas eustigma]|eukprot:GAX75315.1 hypothetical protein CEUSTIGMA_g2760.t1 [Chlamydomonas eustigma]
MVKFEPLKIFSDFFSSPVFGRKSRKISTEGPGSSDREQEQREEDVKIHFQPPMPSSVGEAALSKEAPNVASGNLTARIHEFKIVYNLFPDMLNADHAKSDIAGQAMVKALDPPLMQLNFTPKINQLSSLPISLKKTAHWNQDKGRYPRTSQKKDLMTSQKYRSGLAQKPVMKDSSMTMSVQQPYQRKVEGFVDLTSEVDDPNFTKRAEEASDMCNVLWKQNQQLGAALRQRIADVRQQSSPSSLSENRSTAAAVPTSSNSYVCQAVSIQQMSEFEKSREEGQALQQNVDQLLNKRFGRGASISVQEDKELQRKALLAAEKALHLREIPFRAQATAARQQQSLQHARAVGTDLLPVRSFEPEVPMLSKMHLESRGTKEASPPTEARDCNVISIDVSDEGEDDAEDEGEEEAEEVEEGEEEADEERRPDDDEWRRGGERQQEAFVVTDEEAQTWKHIHSKQGCNANDLVINYKSFEIPRMKMWCLMDREWLNDEAINIYMTLLQERDTLMRLHPPKGSKPPPKCHFFNSFFLNKLYKEKGEYSYDMVKRWTMPNRLKNHGQVSSNIVKDVELIIVPVNCNNQHWTCAAIDIKSKTLSYYDSFKSMDEVLLNHLAHWLEDEAANKCDNYKLDTSGWKRLAPKNIPQQQNSYDCGMFTIMFAHFLGLGMPFNFRQSDISNLRKKVLHALIKNKIEF